MDVPIPKQTLYKVIDYCIDDVRLSLTDATLKIKLKRECLSILLNALRG